MKRPSDKEMARMKEELYINLAQGNLTIREATRRMRKILGMNQKEYAHKVARISPRILSEFENGSGNPTLKTLEKIALPFGLTVTFLPPESWRLYAQKNTGFGEMSKLERSGK
jgi:transcriptional regulator with XRE-family HTH domain